MPPVLGIWKSSSGGGAGGGAAAAGAACRETIMRTPSAPSWTFTLTVPEGAA